MSDLTWDDYVKKYGGIIQVYDAFFGLGINDKRMTSEERAYFEERFLSPQWAAAYALIKLVGKHG